MEYDEQAAIDYIRSHMEDPAVADVSDDEILNLIDVVWDYYEDHGLLELTIDDDDKEDEVNADDVVRYVQKIIAKDKKSPLTPEMVDAMVRLELEYDESIADEL